MLYIQANSDSQSACIVWRIHFPIMLNFRRHLKLDQEQLSPNKLLQHVLKYLLQMPITAVRLLTLVTAEYPKG